MLSRMSSREITEWVAYERIAGPLGPERLDILAGVISATVANSQSKKKHKPADFIPQWDQRRGQTWQEQLAAVRAANRALGGTEVRRSAP